MDCVSVSAKMQHASSRSFCRRRSRGDLLTRKESSPSNRVQMRSARLPLRYRCRYAAPKVRESQKESNEMRKQQGILYGLTLAGLAGVSFLGWSHIAPAHAQDNIAPP